MNYILHLGGPEHHLGYRYEEFLYYYFEELRFSLTNDDLISSEFDVYYENFITYEGAFSIEEPPLRIASGANLVRDWILERIDEFYAKDWNDVSHVLNITIALIKDSLVVESNTVPRSQMSKSMGGRAPGATIPLLSLKEKLPW